MLASFVLSLIAAAAPATALAVSFTAPTNLPVGDGPLGVVSGDFNGDTDPDLAVVNNFSYDVSVLLGGTGASFGPTAYFPAGGVNPRAVAVGDFNADTDLDLAVANSGSGDVSVLLGAAGGSFGAATSVAVSPGGGDPQAIAVGDFNADDDPDLAVVNVGVGVAVLLGGPDATFGTANHFAAGSQARSIAVGDFNADDDPDLAVVNSASNNVSVLLGDTGGSFEAATNHPLGGTPQPGEDNPGLAISDFNGDSDPDIAVATGGLVNVLLGGMGGSFGAATSFTAGNGQSSLATGNFNADADPDLVLTNFNFPAFDNVSVLLGGPAASFGAPTSFPVGAGPSWVVVDDFNADGDQDLAVANSLSDNASVLLNREHAPDPPTLTGSDPDSPANDNSPNVKGTAALGSTVRLYSTADCSGSPVATGPAAEFASSGLAVSVPDDSTTSFRATATNSADVPSLCSSSVLTYVEHSSPPNAAVTASPNPALTGATVSFDASSSTGFGIIGYTWDLDGNGTFETDTGLFPTATHSFAAARDISPAVRVTNDIGSDVEHTALSIRLAPPPGPVGVSVVALDGDRRFTNDPRVNVVAVWPPLTRTLVISNDGGFANPGAFPVAAQTPWTLDASVSGRLPKTVYVRFDGASQTFTDDIVLDVTDPVINSATLEGAAPQGAAAARTRRYRIRLRARDNASGVERFQLGGKGRGTSRPKRLRRASRAVSRTLSVRSSFKPRRIRVQDAAGNWSRWKRIKRAR